MSNLTTFQLVSHMNTAFNNPKGDPLNINWPRIQKQCLNIPDEVGELFAALGGHEKGSPAYKNIENAVTAFKAALAGAVAMPGGAVNVHGVRDALCDIPVFSCGAQHLMGVDGDRDMRAVIGGAEGGVMSRFIKNDEDKQATIEIHAAKGVTQVYFQGEYPVMVMKSALDQPDAPKDKFLKSASYIDAVFYDLNEVAAPATAVGTFMDLANMLGKLPWEGQYGLQSVTMRPEVYNGKGVPTLMSAVFQSNDHVDPENEPDWDPMSPAAGSVSDDEDDEEGDEDTCGECDHHVDDCECLVDDEADSLDPDDEGENECDCPPEGHSGCSPDRSGLEFAVDDEGGDGPVLIIRGEDEDDEDTIVFTDPAKTEDEGKQ